MRRQGVIRFEMPEDTLPPDHGARLIWQVLQTLDLSAFTAKSWTGLEPSKEHNGAWGLLWMSA